LRKTEDEFAAFRQEVNAAWPEIEIQKPELRRVYPPTVQMFYSEDRMDREVHWSGFGFQVWMQILTHLYRAGPDATIIIDEADIYLHPDLQRRLLRTLRERFRQFILATHSVKIINDGEAREIVSISSRYRSGKRISTDQEYAALYKYIGSSDNADFARIARSRKVIFVEGKDQKILRRFAARFGFLRLADLQNIPIIQLGGFSQWKKAANAVWAFQKVLELEIQTMCVFDRDYRCDGEINEFIAETAAQNLNARVLEFKEIENYVLDVDAIRRASWKRIKAKNENVDEPSLVDVEGWLDMATADLKMTVMAKRATQSLQFEKERGSPLDASTIFQIAGSHVEEIWVDLRRRLGIVPGKEALSRLNDILQERYGISITEAMIIEQMERDKICESLGDLLVSLEEFCSN
jgi:hypothetical protein